MLANFNERDFVSSGGDTLEGKLAEKMNMFIEGGATKRFHTVRTLKDNTVAEHSFGVAHFLWLVSDGKASAAAVMAALSHDLAEQHVGDIPSPAKKALGIREDYWLIEEKLLATAGLNFESSLTDDEILWLKLADIFDGMSFCIIERNMGNKEVAKAFNNFRNYGAPLVKNVREVAIFQLLCKAWHHAEREGA